jgi:CheY-like chemotaxis protein
MQRHSIRGISCYPPGLWLIAGTVGYQSIGMIRKKRAFPRLPNITLTAKAMKADHEKCLEAYASDDLAKPVNTE